MWRSFWTLVTSEIALPRAAPGARLKETVMAGNCPWWLIERDWVLVSKWEKALKGTALLFALLVTPAEVEPLLEVLVDVPAVSAFIGAERVFADGVKSAEVVRALEPAEVEPFPEELAAAPCVPAAELDWM